MIKPTKTTVRPASSSTSTITRVDSDAGAGTVRNNVDPDSLMPDLNPQPGTSTLLPPRTEVVEEPRVVVTYISDPVITEANARLAEIALPGLQTHLLQPHESVDGLYLAPSGQTYAHLEEGRYYRVELNAEGNYQIPWPAAPGVTPPILKQIPGQSRWRIEAQWYASESAQGSLFMPRLTAEDPLAIFHVDPNLATLLPAAHEAVDGIRMGPRGKIYVNLAEGTVMVRKIEQGEYKLASATTMNVPDITLEQIPGQSVWRRKLQINHHAHQDPLPGSSRDLSQPDESGPGPVKRARTLANSNALDPFELIRISELWQQWGSVTKPLTGHSIEIGGKHFSIVEQPTHTVDALAFIKPPQFSATRFDAFEQLLLNTPELQPRGVVKLADGWTGEGSDTWKIVEGLPFEKSLTQHVSDQFTYLSDHSANKVAREMFNRANQSDEITGPGIHALFETFKKWSNRYMPNGDNRFIRQDLSDPLMLLSPLATDANGNMHMPLPSAEGLQRIDFNPKLFFSSQYKRQRQSTRSLFKDILRGHGYSIAHDFGANLGDALLIKRLGVDPIFIMFMDRVHNNTVLLPDPVTWLKKRALVNKMDAHVKDDLREHFHSNKIIYLLGTNERLPTHEDNLIVTRHS
jgi:hypothetical protein